MAKNIKEIGKELLGKSLNSFHKKTGLTQLEKNNEVQDSILNGILSQVDDAYIEKTEQSNVMHLDGSGDGAVVLDSIEGNTMVNLIQPNYSNMSLHNGNSKENDMVVLNGNGTWQRKLIGYNHILPIKPNTNYTVVVDIISNTLSNTSMILLNSFTSNLNKTLAQGTVGRQIFRGTTISELSTAQGKCFLIVEPTDSSTKGSMKIKVMIFEGHIDDDKIPSHIFGLQSSFEEQVEDDKYKIEILINNKNLFNKDTVEKDKALAWASGMHFIEEYSNTSDFIRVNKGIYSLTNPNSTIQICAYDSNKNALGFFIDETTLIPLGNNGSGYLKKIQIKDDNIKYIRLGIRRVDSSTSVDLNKVQFEISETLTTVTPHKSNKIKLLINEPLRAIGDIKDRLCVKDGMLVVERRCGFKELGKAIYNEGFGYLNRLSDDYYRFQAESNKYLPNINTNGYTRNNINNFPIPHFPNYEALSEGYYIDNSIVFRVHKDRIGGTGISDFRRWAKDKDLKIVYPLKNAYYEEVLNEYGEPILFEGYENGTLYIDSTIVPTTTVRYTPKMESFKTVKEVKSNNSLLSNDINESIIPYMMEVDMLIMEKEMSLFSSLNKNIRKMEVLDMTSMQKRTGEMLTRLIKGKTLTKEEAQTRVTVYLNAGKITDEQAKELNFLIDEIYA